MLRVYKFDAEGLALGAVIIVISKTVKDALHAAKTWASENQVDPETVRLGDIEDFEAGVVYAWNGDY